MSLIYQTMGDVDEAWFKREEAKEEKERKKEEILSKASAPRYAAQDGPGVTPEEVGSWVRKEVYEPLFAKIVMLEMRVKELEETATRYRGIYKSDRVYHPQDEVTHSGTTWICQVTCEGSTPGKSVAHDAEDRPMTRSARGEALEELYEIVDTLLAGRDEDEANEVMQRVYVLGDKLGAPELQPVPGRVLSFKERFEQRERLKRFKS
jgi:hypothetical protein